MDAEKDPAVTGTQTPETKAAEPAAAEKMFAQSEVNRLVGREVGAVKRERDAIAAQHAEATAKLAEYEAKAREAEEAKLTAAQREALDRKRDAEAHAKALAAVTAERDGERAKRHTVMRRQAAASKVAEIAPRLFNADLTDDLIERVLGDVVVEVDAAGVERAMLRVGTTADLEPVETGWPKYVDAKLAKYFAASGGSGARHGAGVVTAGGGRTQWGGLTPAKKIEVAFGAKR